VKFTNKKACELLKWDRKVQADDKGSGHCLFVPKSDAGFCIWDLPALVAGQFYMDCRSAGQTVKQAGQAATRLLAGMRDYPGAAQLTVLTLENGSRSILPTDTIHLSTGFISGGYLATALLIDVRNLAARVQRLVDADAALIGERDE